MDLKEQIKKKILQEYIKNIKIQVQSLEDQERIIKEMEKYDLEIEFKQNEIKKIDEYAKNIFDNYLNKCKENQENHENHEEIKKDNEDNKINELIEELDNISDDEDDNKSNKSNKKSKNKIKNKIEYEKITIKNKEYIKEGKKIYKIKEGEKGKLYGKLDKKGNFEKIV